MPIFIDGKTYTVPDVYGSTEVINLGSTTIPAFNGLLLIFGAKRGIPYNASGKQAYENIRAFSDIPSVKKEYGTGDASKAFAQAKKGGAGVVYMLNAAPLTQAKVTIMDSGTTPVNSFDVIPKVWGAVGNDISLKILDDAVGGESIILTIVPPKNTKFLTANATTSRAAITVDNLEGLAVGMEIKLVSNTVTTPHTFHIAGLVPETNDVLLSLSSGAFATTDYARIYVEDVENQEVGMFNKYTANHLDVIKFINSGKILTAIPSPSATGILPSPMGKISLQAIAGAKKGTSPNANEGVGGDWDLVAESLPLLFEQYRNYTKAKIRIICPITGNNYIMTSYNSIAVSLRNIGYSIINVFGNVLGAINTAEPSSYSTINIAKALNSDNSILVGMGIDGEAAYLSSAPQFAGWLSGNTVKKNTTWDSIQASSVEKFFGESNRDTELKKFVDAGVIVFRTTPEGFFIAQGLTTYQDHTMIWNSSDKKTYLIMQRQIVDYVEEGYKAQMMIALKDDNITVSGAVNQGQMILKKYADEGYIKDDYVVTGYRESNAIITNPKFKPADSNDFVGYKLTVIIE